MSEWYRVEVSDHDGQIVAIEPEMLTGRDIGDRERATIRRAIDQLHGFLGLDAIIEANPGICPACGPTDGPCEHAPTARDFL